MLWCVDLAALAALGLVWYSQLHFLLGSCKRKWGRGLLNSRYSYLMLPSRRGIINAGERITASCDWFGAVDSLVPPSPNNNITEHLISGGDINCSQIRTCIFTQTVGRGKVTWHRKCNGI